jgi:hypothetical protein
MLHKLVAACNSGQQKGIVIEPKKLRYPTAV